MDALEMKEREGIIEALTNEVMLAPETPMKTLMSDKICGGCGHPTEGVLHVYVINVDIRTCEYCACVYGTKYVAEFHRDREVAI